MASHDKTSTQKIIIWAIIIAIVLALIGGVAYYQYGGRIGLGGIGLGGAAGIGFPGA